MGADWKPGAVAMLEVGCHANRRLGLFADGGWNYGKDKWAANDPAIVTARPLVVIDPENRGQVERLVRAFWANGTDDCDDLDAMTKGLREFANPTPPKPEVYTHLTFGADSGIRTALCGKVWRPNGDVNVVGKCPECAELADDGWLA